MSYIDELEEAMGKNKKCSPTDLADLFLKDNNLLADDFILLRYWNNQFYIFNGICYELKSDSEIRARVTLWLRNNTSIRRHAKKNNVTEIIEQFKALGLTDFNKKPPFSFGKEYYPKRHIVLKNGILDLKTKTIHPHDPRYFTLNCFPFEYNESINADTWLKVLKKVQPNPDARKLIQEWFGYNLIPNTSYQKFCLMCGEGANGKTVICTVLRSLLGRTNTSAVGLEAFNPMRTFPIASTMGKLANIVEELNEITNTAEGMLKNYVAGGLMTVENKNKPPFDMIPTARLTYATNVLPRFRDRSKGLWRRLILIKFSNIIKPSEQDKRLTLDDFWLSSGELPGVFNWAIEGLNRLEKNNGFTKVKDFEDDLQTYQAESNPAKTFLLQNYETNKGSEVSANELYYQYGEWIKENGYRSLSSHLFSKEVSRVFPDVRKSKNPVRRHYKRTRIWHDLKLINTELEDDIKF